MTCLWAWRNRPVHDECQWHCSSGPMRPVGMHPAWILSFRRLPSQVVMTIDGPYRVCIYRPSIHWQKGYRIYRKRHSPHVYETPGTCHCFQAGKPFWGMRCIVSGYVPIYCTSAYSKPQRTPRCEHASAMRYTWQTGGGKATTKEGSAVSLADRVTDKTVTSPRGERSKIVQHHSVIRCRLTSFMACHWPSRWSAEARRDLVVRARQLPRTTRRKEANSDACRQDNLQYMGRSIDSACTVGCWVGRSAAVWGLTAARGCCSRGG